MAMLGDTVRFDTAREINSRYARLDHILKEIDAIRNRLEAMQNLMKDNPTYTNDDRQELRALRTGMKDKLINAINAMSW